MVFGDSFHRFEIEFGISLFQSFIRRMLLFPVVEMIRIVLCLTLSTTR